MLILFHSFKDSMVSSLYFLVKIMAVILYGTIRSLSLHYVFLENEQKVFSGDDSHIICVAKDPGNLPPSI